MVKFHVYNSRDEWLKARTSYIGGSDAASIIGLSPYKSNTDLWEEKLGIRKSEDISDKPYVKYGNDAEPLLRALFALDHPEYKVSYVENNIWTSDEVPWAHASLDGWLLDENGRKGIWECKTTEIFQPAQWKHWDNCIPDNYYCQILHYFAVTGFEFAILNAQIKFQKDGRLAKTTRFYKIERSECENDIQYLMQKEQDFADKLKNKIRPATILPAI